MSSNQNPRATSITSSSFLSSSSSSSPSSTTSNATIHGSSRTPIARLHASNPAPITTTPLSVNATNESGSSASSTSLMTSSSTSNEVNMQTAALSFTMLNSINDGPGELYGHTMVVHALSQRLVVFGGATKAGSFADTIWLLDLRTLLWESVAPPSVATSPNVVRGRHFHTATLVGNSMFVFGGKSNGYLNDLLCFDLNSLSWLVPEQLGSAPSRRYGHSATYVEREESLVIFGGYDDLGYVSDELFAWHIPSGQWRRINYMTPSPDIVLSRYQHAAVVHGEALWVFGGRFEHREQFVGELLYFSFVTLTWARVVCKGKSPAPRWGHALVSTGRCLYVIGGSDYVLAFKDVFKFSLQRLSWKRCSIDEANALEPRFFFGAVLHNNAIYISAGRNIHHYLYKDVLRTIVNADKIGITENYLLDMWRLLETSSYADVEFRLAMGSLYAHRGVLCARSEALSAMFRSGMREGDINGQHLVSITLANDEDYDAWRQLLFFLYSGSLALPLRSFPFPPHIRKVANSLEKEEDRERDLLVELLLLADRYLLSSLKLECGRRLKRHLTVGSLPALHSLAERVNVPILLRATQKRAILWRQLLSHSTLSPSLRAYLKASI